MHSAFLDILVASIEGLKLIISVNNAIIYAVSCKYYSYSFCFVFFFILSSIIIIFLFMLCKHRPIKTVTNTISLYQVSELDN